MRALVLLRPQVTVAVPFQLGLELLRHLILGKPHTEVERKRERGAADGVGEAGAERLKVDDVNVGADVTPSGAAGEGGETHVAKRRPGNLPDRARHVACVHVRVLPGKRFLSAGGASRARRSPTHSNVVSWNVSSG